MERGRRDLIEEGPTGPFSFVLSGVWVQMSIYILCSLDPA